MHASKMHASKCILQKHEEPCVTGAARVQRLGSHKGVPRQPWTGVGRSELYENVNIATACQILLVSMLHKEKFHDSL